MPESVPLRTPPLTPESRSRTPRSTAAFDDTITIGSKAAVEADRVRLAANAAAKEAAANAERLVADAAIEAERASFGQCRRWQKASRAEQDFAPEAALALALSHLQFRGFWRKT